MKHLKLFVVMMLAICLVACSKPASVENRELPYSAEELVTMCIALTNQVYTGEVEQMVDGAIIQTLSSKTYEDISAFVDGTYQDVADYVQEYFTDFKIEQYLYSTDDSVSILVSYQSGTRAYYYITGTLTDGVFSQLKVYDGLDTIK